MMDDVKYPEIEVQISDTNGNALVTTGLVSRALRVAGVDPDEIAEFRRESMSGDYENLLATAQRWVTVS